METPTVDPPAGNEAIHKDPEETPRFESRNPAMIALLEAAKRAAAAETTILLTGESGTGKNALARQIHRWSARRDGPFVIINCTAFAAQLLENELFGHVRGAFTGAIDSKPGRLEAGDGGTVLFDEIAELPTTLQAKFLRFIQERRFERLGGRRTLTINVRILASSNRNLEVEVAERRFREDLYYRLNVITFTLPPLRDRVQDILPMAAWILRQIALKTNRPELGLSAEAAAALVSYRWPGNIRELHNALERCAALGCREIIMPVDLPEPISKSVSCVSTVDDPNNLERDYILRTLAQSSTLAEAAARLGINVATLWRKRKRYGIE